MLARAARDRDGLAVAAGDGTLAEVAAAMDRARQVLLPLAGGTGNGLARDLGTTRLEAALAAARMGRRRWIDLVRALVRTPAGAVERLVVSTAGAGYAADTVALAGGRFGASIGRGRLPTAWKYPLAAALCAFRASTRGAWVRFDAASPAQVRLTNVMIANSRHAGNFRAFPDADLVDGRLEVLVAAAGPLAQLRHNLAVLSGRYDYSTGPIVQARAVSLRFDAPCRLMLDGELVDAVTAARFSVLPRALRVVALPDSAAEDGGGLIVPDSG
jgi:diacylglycerol kinase family enzyme